MHMHTTHVCIMHTSSYYAYTCTTRFMHNTTSMLTKKYGYTMHSLVGRARYEKSTFLTGYFVVILLLLFTFSCPRVMRNGKERTRGQCFRSMVQKE